jgi:hypothetical protein
VLEGLLLGAQKDVGIFRHDCDGSEASEAMGPTISKMISNLVWVLRSDCGRRMQVAEKCATAEKAQGRLN